MPSVDPDDPQAAFDAGLRLLARREHSRRELDRKLTSRRFTVSAIGCALDSLEAAGYLDEQRFAEMIVRHRRDSAYGPVRIRVELGQHGVPESVVTDAVKSVSEEAWLTALCGWLTRRRESEIESFQKASLKRRSQRRARRALSSIRKPRHSSGGLSKVEDLKFWDSSEPGVEMTIDPDGSDLDPTDPASVDPSMTVQPDWLEARLVELALARGFSRDQAVTAVKMLTVGTENAEAID